MRNKGYWKSPVVNIYHISEEKKVMVLYNTALYRKIILIDLDQERVECKVIRIGKRVQPDISKARQQVNIDRPAYNKTDKQCRTRTTITARLPDG